MKLHFRTLGEGYPMIVLHGVFGSSDNWQTVGKDFADTYKVYLIDLRNHGKSPHSDVFNYDVMAEDLRELLHDEKLKEAYLIGHSMGGKVAMNFATKYPEKVKKLIVVDIAPKHYPPHHQQIFKGFKSVELNKLRNRKDADDQMASIISNFGIRQFILKNLEREKDGNFKWKLNLKAIEKAAEEIGVGLEKKAANFKGDTLFVAGSKSNYILEKDHELIRSFFPKATILTIEGAGHWVHAEKPKELQTVVSNFII
ncbi:MAG: alpha/beta fold hydrolase [Bacteroidota bacterium]